MEVFIKIIQLIMALGLLIVIHEGGHFLFAKLFGVRVEKFYLFFDPKFHLFSTYDKWFRKWLKKPEVKKDENGTREYVGTEYGIGWIPLGGYVKIAGMIDESLDTEQMKKKPEEWEFRTKPAWKRLLIMLGGVLMNFVAAFFIYSMVLYAWGKDYVKSEDITAGMKFCETAKKIGFQDGDIIMEADGDSLKTWNESSLLALSEAKTAKVKRNGKMVDISLPDTLDFLKMMNEGFAIERLPLVVDSILPDSPFKNLKKGDSIVSLNGKEIEYICDLDSMLNDLKSSLKDGANAKDLNTLKVSFVVSNGDSLRNVEATLKNDFKLGIKFKPYESTHEEYGFFESFPAGWSYGWNELKDYVTSLKYVFTEEGAKSVGGFVTIGSLFPGAWDWRGFWLMTAFISIMLGIANLLPIPALDGGHALFCIYEMITGRKPSDKFLLRAQIVGFFFLVTLLIWANLNDILKLLE